MMDEATGDGDNVDQEVTAAEEAEAIDDDDEVDGSSDAVVIDGEEETIVGTVDVVVSVKDDCCGLVREIVSIVEFLDQINDYRRTQQKECFNLVRRLKILIPVMDEIRCFDESHPPSSSSSSPDSCRHFLYRLRKVILVAKKLLETCNNGSKIFLVQITKSESLFWIMIMTDDFSSHTICL